MFAAFGGLSAGDDQGAGVQVAQVAQQGVVAFEAAAEPVRAVNVQVGQVAAVELRDQVAEGLQRVGIVNIAEGIDVEIVEEFESYCAINAVTNYILQANSKLNLSTFYQNHMSALSFCLRNVIVQDTAKYSHIFTT